MQEFPATAIIQVSIITMVTKSDEFIEKNYPSSVVDDLDLGVFRLRMQAHQKRYNNITIDYCGIATTAATGLVEEIKDKQEEDADVEEEDGQKEVSEDTVFDLLKKIKKTSVMNALHPTVEDLRIFIYGLISHHAPLNGSLLTVVTISSAASVMFVMTTTKRNPYHLLLICQLFQYIGLVLYASIFGCHCYILRFEELMLFHICYKRSNIMPVDNWVNDSKINPLFDKSRKKA
ncbi:hypothetical protein RFI_36966 [Reticulomyxa filosa]|uniref:Uncharacterized protein n=1 Tax=Reticulomyxa filosa TaxID=46433 RepID=X6LES3_RETFI|nr:hypothetical protein RFI_36966 [Reticulomyxa filosa]|eukprot:ETO00478.1 hypothetical protein RFI_36966 [Reticulomyxa filosa]